ncbi:hypothetical protein HSB1_24170 [Halogranum salarium B-1]|uniref:Uncharacterized protein n=1 Tax=Halogranum salarium B-1 TaxID=1210908 RepID=J3JF82_9EURY|nr:hypothetical protein HSB1_24170 [Halogranum salarium B-1]
MASRSGFYETHARPRGPLTSDEHTRCSSRNSRQKGGTGIRTHSQLSELLAARIPDVSVLRVHVGGERTHRSP